MSKITEKSTCSELDCAIVRDILPLYRDDVVSDTTKTAVEKHLEHCEACSAEDASLRIDLPKDGTANAPKAKFAEMAKKLKRYRIFTVSLIVVLSCLLLTVTTANLAEIRNLPIPDSEFEVDRVYRYESEYGNVFFVLCSYPENYRSVFFNGSDSLADISQDGAKDQIMTWTPYASGSQFSFLIPSSSTDQVKIKIFHATANSNKEIDVLKFGDKTVWTKEANGSDTVPDYVDAYLKFYGVIPGGDDIVNWHISADDDILGAEYKDGRCILWDLDGNVVYDKYVDDSGEYPDFPIKDR